jgi:[ribulose-bisphosphate carboxylase]-lysine N-methyltransferase
MVTPFTLSPSSTFLFPTKTLKRFSALTLSKRQPRPLSVTVTSVRKPGSDIDSPPLPPNVQTFWQWLRDEGVVSAKAPARPALVSEGLGLVAQRDLSRNEVVLEVPKRLWINPDAVAASEIGSVCSELKPWVSVALFLIREKRKSDSPWRFYFDILPETTNSTIYWWVWLSFGCLSFVCWNSVFSMDLKLWGWWMWFNGCSAGQKRSWLNFKVSVVAV